jgi:hypothetical protein
MIITPADRRELNLPSCGCSRPRRRRGACGGCGWTDRAATEKKGSRSRPVARQPCGHRCAGWSAHSRRSRGRAAGGRLGHGPSPPTGSFLLNIRFLLNAGANPSSSGPSTSDAITGSTQLVGRCIAFLVRSPSADPLENDAVLLRITESLPTRAIEWRAAAHSRPRRATHPFPRQRSRLGIRIHNTR